MVDHRSLQAFLKTSGHYSGELDGVFGRASNAAVDKLLAAEKLSYRGWPAIRRRVAAEQILFKSVGIDPGKNIVVDGIAGPVYQYALELWQNHLRDVTPSPAVVAHQPEVWPRQSQVSAFYGGVGTSQVDLVSPYPLYLDWALSTKISKFKIHSKCKASALRVMEKVLEHYGPEKIHEMGLDQFGGCLNVRKMRGGSAWSMHSWGIAIDWDADRNPLRSTSRTARFAQPEYAKFLDFWEEEGWISLGRERNYDWMHVQAARL